MATARARARLAMTEDIKAAARRQLAETGSDGLSLRAVARELGVVSSAVYRYFSSREDLLTALIIDAYEAVGAVAEDAVADRRGGTKARWSRMARAVRAWAIANPHDYALVYGSPVPGYQAPTDTVDPAMRVTIAALGVVRDGIEAGEVVVDGPYAVARSVHADFSTIREGLEMDLPDEVLSRALAGWTGLLGHISFELFGHLHGGVSDYDAFFDHQLARSVDALVG